MSVEQGIRMPPQAVEAERAVLGSVLVDPVGAVPKVVGSGLKSAMFYDRKNTLLFEVLEKMAFDGENIDGLNVAERCKKEKVFDQIGGFDFLAELMDSVGVAGYVNDYCGRIKECWLLREVILNAGNLVDAAYRAETEAHTLIQSIPGLFTPLLSGSKARQSNGEILDKWYDRMEAIKKGDVENGLPLPWPGLDGMMGGLEPGLIIVGARPSAGKTTLEVNICDNLARQGCAVARACLDMSREALLSRSVIREARVSLPKLKNGFARWDQMQTVKDAKELVSTWPMHIIEERTLEAIVSETRALKIKHDIQLLTIDFVQLVHLEKGGHDRRLEIGKMTSALKALAFELDIPVVLLSQLSRGSDKDERRPKLSDLRESGDLEQDATQVLLLSKAKEDDYTGELDPDLERKVLRPVVIELAKNQNGEMGYCGCFYMRPNYFRFEEGEPDFVDMHSKLGDFQQDYEASEFVGEDIVVEEERPEVRPKETQVTFT